LPQELRRRLSIWGPSRPALEKGFRCRPDTHWPVLEARLRCLLAQGVRPCWPTQTNSIGMRFAWCPPGTFHMGSPEDEVDRDDNEGPRHAVTISRPFFLGVYPVTQAQYREVTSFNPFHFSPNGDGRDKVGIQETQSFPVENVSWDEAVAFCRK